MKILNGTELVDYIKERQAKQVRALSQSWQVLPKLAIVQNGDNTVIDIYVRLKKAYGEDIGVEVEILTVESVDLISTIKKLNDDESIHGIIVQLPLEGQDLTEEAINSVVGYKDVDGLGEAGQFTPATAMAIDWLLAGYNVELIDKKIVIVGKGRLVGAPLAKLWREAGLDITVLDSKSNLAEDAKPADVVITATGVPGLIKSDMIQYGAVVVDAGTASENGRVVGDLADDVRTRDDLTITPIKGGVGPLTIAALFDNVITAARRVANQKGQQDL